MALWDGRFQGGPAQDMVQFSECLGIDLQMWPEDIEGSKAHAVMLGEVGLLTKAEVATLHEGLSRVAEELASGAYVPPPESEDIHMAVEARLTELVGDVGRKLHTARSRNDQVAVDVRLWLKARLNMLLLALVDVVDALVERAERDGDVLMPGYTHLQRGQPILFGHHVLAYAWMVKRDVERVIGALRRVDICPLGAGAMAGTPHPIDRKLTSELLGFAEPASNAMDAVSARDHVIEAVSACSIAMTTLSRMSEELVLWSTSEYRFVRLADAYSTGSSIMPQKRNPDAAELIRGKSARVIGALMALLTLVKAQPLAYNRDLQEDREQLFDALNTTLGSARIMAGLWRTLDVRRDRFEDTLRGDFLLATELADFLVTKGVPFRDAHHVTGQIVGWCEQLGGDFSLLDVDRLKTFHPAFDEEAMAWLDPRAAAERRTSFGGTSSGEVARQVGELRAWIARFRRA